MADARSADTTHSVQAIVAYQAGFATVDNDQSLESLGIDSLDRLMIAMDCEKMIADEIPDDEMVKWRTVGDVVHYVLRGGR